MALLNFGSRTGIAHPLGYLALDLAITLGKWSAVRALSTRNAPSTILTSPKVRQYISMPAPGSPLHLEAPESTFRRPACLSSYHPQSPFAVYHTAFLLRRRLKSVSEQLYRQKSCTGLLELILDFARYWTRSSDEINAISQDVLQAPQKQALEAEITIGEGIIRKIEIIVFPGFMCDNAKCRYKGSKFYSCPVCRRRTSTKPLFSRVQLNQATSPSILDLSFLSKRRPYERRDQTFPVSGDRWVKITDHSNPSWMQAWQLSRYHNPNIDWTLETDKLKPQLSDNVVEDLVKSLEKGDRIIVKPTTNFFVQDIALYSGFRFNIYYSWDLASSSEE